MLSRILAIAPPPGPLLWRRLTDGRGVKRLKTLVADPNNMIMPQDFTAPEGSRHPDPHALLRSIERYLAEGQPVKDAAVHEAQQLVYDAWEAATGEQARLLTERALKLDPLNVDALLQALAYSGLAVEEEIEPLRRVVAAGEKRLGPQAFEEYAGAFWGFVETRPYMRARQRLAEVLRAAGRLEEAIAEFEAMLALNPNDNQGVRYSLLPVYLQLNRLDGAEKLLTKYDEAEFSVVFAWGRVLERFLSGDLPGAVKALAVARKQNPYMQGYVKGHRRIPSHPPGAYAPGSKDEAGCFAEVLREAWGAHPEARRWLDTQK